jgi:hypothetical protein
VGIKLAKRGWPKRGKGRRLEAGRSLTSSVISTAIRLWEPPKSIRFSATSKAISAAISVAATTGFSAAREMTTFSGTPATEPCAAIPVAAMTGWRAATASTSCSERWGGSVTHPAAGACSTTPAAATTF